MQKTYIMAILAMGLVAIGTSSAFAEVDAITLWVGSDDLHHVDVDFNCREFGNGQLRFTYYEDYVYVALSVENHGSNTMQRQFSYDDFNTDIVPYYFDIIGKEAALC